tara:strand:+ start:277 stop:798 length:522 start_codon:yes stop_codon:yes gene_type:complete
MSIKKHNIIYADPPWKQTKGGLRKARPNQTRKLDYFTLSLNEIENIIRSFCPQDNHALFVWTIDKFLHQTEHMFKDYRLHARMIWDKTNGVAPAFTVRYSHEYLLWFYKPKMIPIDISQRGKWTTVLREQATKHSKKPEIAYKFIESIYPNLSKIELFARNKREGWDSLGDEL